MPDLFVPQPGTRCPSCNGTRIFPATGRSCPSCQGTGLGARNAAGAGGGSVSPNRFPPSRSAGLPSVAAGSGIRIVETPLQVPPAWPTRTNNDPYGRDISAGEYEMRQTFCNVISVGAASVQLLQPNPSRKAVRIANPDTAISIFVDWNNGPATIRSTLIVPLGSIEMWVGYKEYIPKQGIFAIASAAGPVLVSVTEFS